MYAYNPFSPQNGITTRNGLSYFSHLLMITLILHGIIINLLLLYWLSYFVFCLLVIFVSFYVLVLALWLASELLNLHIHKHELNWIIYFLNIYNLHFSILNNKLYICQLNYYYYYYFLCLFVCLLFCINVFLLQCLSVICLWLYVVFVHNVITCVYTVMCL
jgi:hypothetical protein